MNPSPSSAALTLEEASQRLKQVERELMDLRNRDLDQLQSVNRTTLHWKISDFRKQLWNVLNRNVTLKSGCFWLRGVQFLDLQLIVAGKRGIGQTFIDDLPPSVANFIGESSLPLPGACSFYIHGPQNLKFSCMLQVGRAKRIFQDVEFEGGMALLPKICLLNDQWNRNLDELDVSFTLLNASFPLHITPLMCTDFPAPPDNKAMTICRRVDWLVNNIQDTVDVKASVLKSPQFTGPPGLGKCRLILQWSTISKVVTLGLALQSQVPVSKKLPEDRPYVSLTVGCGEGRGMLEKQIKGHLGEAGEMGILKLCPLPLIALRQRSDGSLLLFVKFEHISVSEKKEIRSQTEDEIGSIVRFSCPMKDCAVDMPAFKSKYETAS